MGKPLEEWRYADAARTVTLINPAWPVAPLYMVPNVAASLLTTVRDYARFLARLVARPPAPGLDLAESTRATMATPQIRINRRNFVVADPANGRAVVVVTNSENGPPVYERVIASLIGRDHPALLRA
jgi:hypothetical protein